VCSNRLRTHGDERCALPYVWRRCLDSMSGMSYQAEIALWVTVPYNEVVRVDVYIIAKGQASLLRRSRPYFQEGTV
jgi:hypothetical protein